MNLGGHIKQLRQQKGLQQKAVALEVGMDQSNYNKIENGKREPSVEILQKIAALFETTVDALLNLEAKATPPPPVTIEDKTTAEKVRLLEQLEEEDKSVIYRLIDTMLTKKKFQDFLQQNIPAL